MNPDPLYVPDDEPQGQPHGAGMVNTAGVFVLFGLAVCAAVALLVYVAKVAR